jgi:hypothetical protein
VNSQAFPKHARRLGAGRWAGRMAGLGSVGPRAGREARPPRADFDPLVHPVAITEHCVIGDQIRVPAAWCDMAGCGVRFADPAALGEADNRARAAAAGWGEDAFGRLLCPACQQRHHLAPVRVLAREPDAATAHPAAGAATRPPGGVSQPGRPLAGRPAAAGRGRHRATQWPRLLLTVLSDHNGWTTPQPVTVPVGSNVPREPTDPRPSATAPRTQDGTSTTTPILQRRVIAQPGQPRVAHQRPGVPTDRSHLHPAPPRCRRRPR